MTVPWLSVVMPVYNGEAYLRESLDSVAAQCHAAPQCNGSPGSAAIEVIAVDDGSTDSSPTILEEFASRLPLRVVRRERGGNWVAATNQAIHEARGEYVTVLHQDDLWLPDRLKTLRTLVEAHPKATLFLHPARFIDERGRPLGTWRCPLPAGESPPAVAVERLLVQNFIAMPTPVFRRQLVTEWGGFDESLRYTADWDMWLKLAAAGTTVYHRKPLAAFRLHRDSQTMNFPLARFREELEQTLGRHAALTKAFSRVERVARFSVAVNASLAARYHGQSVSFGSLAGEWLRLGPWGWRRYLRDSRIIERIMARVRSGLHRPACEVCP